MIPRTIAALAAWTLALSLAFGPSLGRPASTGPELEAVSGLALDRLKPMPRDPGNRWADDAAAAALGQKLFFDVRFSGNGKVSCATCHDPDNDFQDSMPRAKGIGFTNRRTMPIAGVPYSPFLFWDGRKDSLWAQALGPLENPVEHGGERGQYARVVETYYRDEYQRVFGPLPKLDDRDSATRVFVNMGKAIEAYERRFRFGPSRFDRFVAQWRKTGAMPRDILDEKELAGLALFVGKANCVDCHSGPLFTNHKFRNTGVPVMASLPRDQGRAQGVVLLKSDEFNCRSRWSDAKPEQCREIPRVVPASERAFKVPSLRNVADRYPYMHAGQFETLAQVLDHYNRAPKAPSGRTVLKPLHLSPVELGQLEAFLRTLSGGVVTP